MAGEASEEVKEELEKKKQEKNETGLSRDFEMDRNPTEK